MHMQLVWQLDRTLCWQHDSTNCLNTTGCFNACQIGYTGLVQACLFILSLTLSGVHRQRPECALLLSDAGQAEPA